MVKQGKKTNKDNTKQKKAMSPLINGPGAFSFFLIHAYLKALMLSSAWLFDCFFFYDI